MYTLLVADDNRLSRDLVRDVLESADCRVMEASDGQQALELLEAATPDLVLLDVNMPVKDGFAVLEAIRGNPRLSGIPVLAVTANVMQPDRDRILAAGFDAYVTKPINTTALRQRVAGLLSFDRKGDAP